MLTGNLDQEPDERRDVIDTLKILSAIICPVSLDGTTRGVLQADSAERDWFSESEKRFLEAASAWVGLFARRSELVEQVTVAALAESQGRAIDERARLTPREREVAVLVASGLTNDEIAERLFLVRGTVANHIIHILRKLGFSRRVQIATWSVQHGLWTPDAGHLIS
jgi:DNA-binding NarL/FixJ family response regulator